MRTMEDNSEQWRSTGEGLREAATATDCRNASRTGAEQDTAIIVDVETRRPMVQRLVVVSLAVTLQTMRGVAGTRAIDELIELLHNDNLNMEMVKSMIKSSGDCERITREVIEECKGDLK